jgi:hypothetical protein
LGAARAGRGSCVGERERERFWGERDDRRGPQGEAAAA